MIKRNIKDFIRGWFVGDFDPSLYKTGDIEVGYKTYKAGDEEEAHVHKVAVEITLITKGKVLMNDVEYVVGDIIVVLPNEVVKFKAIEDSENVVIKLPSVKGDKCIV